MLREGRLVGVAALLLAVLGGLGLGASLSSSVGPGASGSSCGAHPCVTDQLVLNRTEVVAGNPIHGSLVIVNLTGRTIDLTSMCHLSADVILANDNVRQQPIVAAVLCIRVPPWTMGPGLKRIPVTVLTTFLSCTDDPQAATAGDPACGNRVGLPPLPAGQYKAVFVEPPGEHLPHPEPISVTLTPSPFEAVGR